MYTSGPIDVIDEYMYEYMMSLALHYFTDTLFAHSLKNWIRFIQ